MDEQIEPQGNPVTRSRHRRELALQILLPLGVGVLALAAGAWAAGGSGVASASVWADISLIFLLALALLPALMLAAVCGALAYGAGWLTGRVPGPAHRAQKVMARAALEVLRGADVAARPAVTVRGLAAALRSLGPAIRGERGGE